MNSLICTEIIKPKRVYKRCIQPDCKKSARHGFDKCKKHGGGNRCIQPDCKKSAIHGFSLGLIQIQIVARLILKIKYIYYYN